MTRRRSIITVIVLLGFMVIGTYVLGSIEKRMVHMNEKKSSGQDKNKQQCGLSMSDAELRKLLTGEQYRIVRMNGTESPFMNAYWNNKKPGIYVDVATGEPLFSSTEKFDSGTGWPSFTRPIEKDQIVEKQDLALGMIRTEVRAKKSDFHLGHVFADGPGPTGLRYCINSASLKFIPLEDMEKLGYGKYLGLFGKTASGKKTEAVAAQPAKKEAAVFGAGCFWGVESVFSEVPGVISTEVGYSGGTLKNPTYEDVCSHTTGHAEVVRVEFDPSRVSYQQLLELFWQMHDPTTLNRQGPDVGDQYRSVIFYQNADQEQAARKMKETLNQSGKFKKPIVTEISPAKEFYKAEDYHQGYFKKRGIKPTCHIPLAKK